MVYNTSFLDTSNGVTDIFTGINQNVPSFPLWILGASAIIIFIVFHTEDIRKLLILEGFSISLIAGLFVAMAWIPFLYIMPPILVLFAGVFLTFFAKKDY